MRSCHCSLSIQERDNDVITCKGACAGSFHANCIGMKMFHINVLTILSKNVLWMCDGCMSEFQTTYNYASGGPSMACNDEMLPKSREMSMEDDIKELKNNVADIMTAIASITKMPNSVPKSARVSSQGDSVIPRSQRAPLSGNNVGAFSNYECDRERQNAIDDREFAILLTNVDVSVSEIDIMQMASQAIGIDDPECINVTKLVSKWKSHNLDFVSFKVVMDSKFKSRALSPMIWPRNIKFREFVHRSTQTWKPNLLK